MNSESNVIEFVRKENPWPDFTTPSVVVWVVDALIQKGEPWRVQMREYALLCWIAKEDVSDIEPKEFLNTASSSFISDDQEKHLYKIMRKADKYASAGAVPESWLEDCTDYYLKKLNKEPQIS